MMIGRESHCDTLDGNYPGEKAGQEVYIWPANATLFLRLEI